MVTDKASVLVYGLMLIVLLAGVESQGQRVPPNTGLYFTLNGTMYLPGDTILITNIGIANVNSSDHGTSLECVTTNVNTHCCRSADNPNKKSRGEWYLPDGTRILNSPDTNFYRTRYNRTVRLNRRNNAMSPTGVFTCEVPNDGDSTMNHTATITIDPLLNVMLNGSGGTLAAGQNHILTCEASGGGSMKYTYTWLRNGSVVSGQTSSSYSFSPLLVVHSGQYNCQVTVGTMNVTSRSVSITVVATPTQLYFTLKGNRYEPGDSVLITDVGLHVTSGNNIGPGDSLVCNTTNVNTQCCTDRGGVGEWFFPDGSMVIRNIDDPNRNSPIIRTGRANQVRLVFRTRQTSPIGEYTCVVPVTGESVNQTAGIRLVTELPVTTNPSTSPTTMKTTMVTTTPTTAPPTTTQTTTLITAPPPTPPPTPSTTPSTTQTTASTTATPSTRTDRTTTTMTTPTATTQITPLTAIVVSNGNVLSAGQDHTLACKASGGGSMEYTYTWLKDGSVVSGQTSSEYTFSPLLMVHSGQYSCQLSDGSVTVTSENVTITVGPGLYFTLSGTVYLPGDTILITDIGSDNKSDPLVCNTTNVNTNCCRNSDGGSRGEWYLPDGTRIQNTKNTNFYRTRYTHQVRLNRRNNAMSPTGVFTCEVPNDADSKMPFTATITIVLPQLNATVTRSGGTPTEGQNFILTCTASGGDSMAYTYKWLRNGSVVSGQNSSTYSFYPLLVADSGQYSCQVTVKSLNVTSEVVDITVVDGAGPYSFTGPSSTPHPSTSLTVHPSGGEDRGGSNIAAVVVSVTVLFLVVAIIIAILIFTWYKRWWKQDKYSQQDIPLKEMGLEPVENSDEIKEGEPDEKDIVFIDQEWLKPVFVDVFPERVQQMHEDRDKKFELEYNAIEKSPQASYNTAVILENRVRNRFGNIFPYDFNRVILESKPGELNSDYINASYIDGYQRRKMYIAAQGPTENSLEDFWRMIWEQRVPTIVMLTKVYEERKKCEQYWPENADTPFVPVPGSPLFIKYNFVLPFPEFTIREMTVTNSDEPGTAPLTVTLYHYLGWPDHGVPANAISMVNFVKRVRKSHPYSKEDLLLVHCSAGVGRTGTFITLDAMLERISVKKSINIFEFVTDLRKQRVLMVQTLVQYVFIHDALEELLTCGETEIAAGDIRIIIGKLIAPVGPQDTIGFSKQFKILEKVSNKGKNVDCSDATFDPNIPKNRYEKILPYNYTRVHLRPSAAYGSDYINASFIEGYRQKGVYIATQGPLPHTVNDFWRMIWEQEVRCIVMLCKTEENGEEVCHQYWPLRNGCCETFGKYIVTLSSEEEEEDYIIRKIDILEKQSKTSISQSGFTVTQIQYEKWPEDNVPETTMTILEIANFVQKVQMGSGNKPIVVMCNNGIGRSGAFICMHSQMERMKAEAMVNIFQFIKAVRIQRAGLVTTEEQYEFCHHVLADFLDGFDTYANFKEII